MLAALLLNRQRSDTMSDLAEKISNILIGAVPVAAAAGFLLRFNFEKINAPQIPIGAIVIIPSTDIGAGNIHTNATLLAEDQFTFWIVKSRTAHHLVISFLSHVGAVALVQTL